jgi:hypothetical protein
MPPGITPSPHRERKKPKIESLSGKSSHCKIGFGLRRSVFDSRLLLGPVKFLRKHYFQIALTLSFAQVFLKGFEANI